MHALPTKAAEFTLVGAVHHRERLQPPRSEVALIDNLKGFLFGPTVAADESAANKAMTNRMLRAAKPTSVCVA